MRKKGKLAATMMGFLSTTPLRMRHVKCLAVLAVVFLCALHAGCDQRQMRRPVADASKLGEALFFDPILSRDSLISCASCHRPEFAFADTVALSRGIHGTVGERNTPSAMNQRDRNFYFWDGRAETLEEQALGPMENVKEMDLPVSLILRRLKKNAFYRHSFQNVYGSLPTAATLAKAIAAYEATLETSDSPFDRYMKGTDTLQFTESARRGLNIFNNKGKCFDCHFGPDFTGNDRFKNIGLYNGSTLTDKGRFAITGQPADLGAFKVPGLRNIGQTAPYMHNGMFRTLREVIDYYDNPNRVVPNAINRDTLLAHPLQLSEQDKKDLENFLLSLSDLRFSGSTASASNTAAAL